MSDLESLPNIGATLAARLERAGINDVAMLRDLGSVAALVKIGAQGHPSCYNMLFALEGAIRGIRWHNIPANDRVWLKERLHDLKKQGRREIHSDG